MKFYVLNLFKFVKLEFKGLSNYYDLDDDNNNLNKSNSTDATNNIQNFSSSEIHNTEFINSKDFEKNKNVLESLNSDTFCKKCQNKIESSDKPPCKDYNESLNSPNGTNNTDKFGYNFVLDSIPKVFPLYTFI